MGTKFEGFLELTADLEKMADEFVDKGGEIRGITGALRAGAEIILEQAKTNCPVREGTLKNSLKVVTKTKGAYAKARVGVHKGSPGYYATFVEYGHKGKRPAPPHPFLEPAFDLKKEEAYAAIKADITAKLTKL